MRRVWAMVAMTALGAANVAHGAVTWLASTALSGSDRSGLTEVLEDGVTPANVLGGLSAMDWGQGDVYLLLPDRGPNAVPYAGGERVDNTRSYINRVQTARIGLVSDGHGGWQLNAGLTATKRLASAEPLTGSARGNPGRRWFTGLSSGIDDGTPTRSMRLDSEGLRLSQDGRHFFVSDEYGPFLYEFDRATGLRVRSIKLPDEFAVGSPAPRGVGESATNRQGRTPNRGMEGLALTPDGRTLVGLMQGPLLQDQLGNDGRVAAGVNTRLLTIDLAHCRGWVAAACPMHQYVYTQEALSLGNSEILAIDAQHFLVIERDSLAGNGARKLIQWIDLSGATDVSGIANLPAVGLPPGLQPVRKRLFLDLGAALVAAGQPLQEKYEGLTFGPSLPDGRRLLLVCVDNDYAAAAPSMLHAFAVDAADLKAGSGY